MQHHKFPRPLQRKVFTYFKRFLEMRSSIDERAILNDLDPALQEEVGLFLLSDTVAKNPLFAGLAEAVLAQLVTVVKPAFAVPGQAVVEAGKLGHTMYMLVSGAMSLVDGHDGHEEPLGPGDSFCEELALGLTDHVSFTVCATAASEMFALSQTDLARAFGASDVLAVLERNCREALSRREDERALERKARERLRAHPNRTPALRELIAPPEEANHAPGAKRGRSSLMGGGSSSLPVGFADTIFDALEGVVGEIQRMN